MTCSLSHAASCSCETVIVLPPFEWHRAVDADVGAERLEPTCAHRGQQLVAKIERLFVTLQHRAAELASLGENRRLVDAGDLPVAEDPTAPDHRRADGHRRRA